MKLLEAYALATGQKIGKPFIHKAYFPNTFKKYITIHASSGMPAKNYDYWEDVIEILKPILEQNRIDIIQIGGKDDAPLKGAHFIGGQTSPQQTAYLLSHSICHLSNDSFTAHLAGALDRPLVCVYGSTTIDNHSPYFYNKDLTHLIESKRNDQKPSFAREEAIKTVNFITPEKISEAVLSILQQTVNENIAVGQNRDSLYMGKFYTGKIIEYVPDFALDPRSFGDASINIRLDYCFNEDAFAHLARSRKVTVLTDKPINLNYARMFRQNINFISYEITDETTEEYIHQLKGCGVKVQFIADGKDQKKLTDLRYRFFDETIDEKEDYSKIRVDLEEKIGYNTHYKSNKFLLSQGKLFGGRAGWKAGKPLNSFEDNVSPIIDNEDFWAEAEYFYIFNKK